jgi:hypothetical protein
MAHARSLSSMRTALRALRHAMFGLGIAVSVGIAGQTAAIWLAGPSAPPVAEPVARVETREPGVRLPRHSGFAPAARRFEASYAREADEADGDDLAR